MAEMGAEIIKVEFAPQGDASRNLPVIKQGRSAYYVQQNRGKKSICLDLKSERAKKIIAELIGKVDVVIENFSPGVIERLGFAWPRVRELNPQAIMCSISALGQQGPRASLPGFDYIAQSYAAVTGMIGEPGGPPALPMLGLGDVSAGVHAACAIGYALLHRERTGEGRYIDISLLDAYFHCHELNVQYHALTGNTPQRSGHHHYAVCPLGLFKGRDRYLCIIALDGQWPSLCRAMGRPELIDDERYATNAQRVSVAEDVIAIVQSWIDGQPSDEATLAALEEHHVPAAPVLSIEDAVQEPHMLERGTVHSIKDPKLGTYVIPGMPLRFDGLPHNQELQASYLGEHNVEILSSILGYADSEIDDLYAATVLHQDEST